MFAIRAHICERHLVSAEGPFDRDSIDFFRTCPTLRRAQDDHRPHGHAGSFSFPRILLNRLNFVHNRVERVRHLLMDSFGLVAFNEKGLVPIPGVKLYQIIVRHAARYSRVGDFVAIEMKDRQYGSITGRIQELVRMPASGERSRLGFAIADYAADQQIWIVEGRTIRMRNRIA